MSKVDTVFILRLVSSSADSMGLVRDADVISHYIVTLPPASRLDHSSRIVDMWHGRLSVASASEVERDAILDLLCGWPNVWDKLVPHSRVMLAVMAVTWATEGDLSIDEDRLVMSMLHVLEGTCSFDSNHRGDCLRWTLWANEFLCKQCEDWRENWSSVWHTVASSVIAADQMRSLDSRTSFHHNDTTFSMDQLWEDLLDAMLQGSPIYETSRLLWSRIIMNMQSRPILGT